MTSIPGLAIEKLTAIHRLSDFDCGKDALNQYLVKYALANQQANSAQTYVACVGADVWGYYSLTVGAVNHADASERVKKSMPRYPIPVMILARLAVATRAHRRGLGAALLKDALLRTERAADIAGIRALLVHAKDDEARAFYERFDFDTSPTDSFHLFLLMKDIRQALK